MRRALPRLAALALMLPLAASAEGTWTYSGDVAGGYDSNVGHGGKPDDMRSSATAYAGTQANWERRYGLYTALQVRTGLAFEEVFDLGALSNVRLGTRVRLLHKPGKGFRTPVLGAWLGAGVREYGSEIRDGYDLRAGVSAAAPLTTTIEARLEAMVSQREAAGRVFDLTSSSYALNLDWRAAENLIVYGGARFDDGDFAVTAQGHGVVTPKTEHLYLGPRARAIEADSAFGDDWWAFRVESQTWIATAGVNVPLSRNLAFDAQVQRGRASMGKFQYVRDVVSAGLLYRW